eukprot:GCRY01000220.1.p1 GENE.GCRY01000220.1~~GCRY01000220.1.p1  ORF type:complete len:220 (+),score=43.23 GCRY01000220.1:99-758(+)
MVGSKNALIVHAHPEEKSFCSALKNTAVSVLEDMGWTVNVSDLYKMKWNPISGPENFTAMKPGTEDFFKQQEQERWAKDNDTFAEDIKAEQAKFEACDVLIFTFPLSWFSIPAMAKGWIEKVFTMGKYYGKGTAEVNEGKRGMLVFTTGGPPAMYPGDKMHKIMYHLHDGIFAFPNITPLDFQVAWSAAHVDDATRKQYLKDWEDRLRKDLTKEEPLKL